MLINLHNHGVVKIKCLKIYLNSYKNAHSKLSKKHSRFVFLVGMAEVAYLFFCLYLLGAKNSFDRDLGTIFILNPTIG